MAEFSQIERYMNNLIYAVENRVKTPVRALTQQKFMPQIMEGITYEYK